MSQPTSTSFAFLRRHLGAMCFGVAIVAITVASVAVFHSRSTNRQHLLGDAQTLSAKSARAGFATEINLQTAPAALTVSAPRSLATEPVKSDDDNAAHTGISFSPADLSEIEQSLSWYQQQIDQCRTKKRDSRWYEEHRNALLKRKAQLLAAIPNLAPTATASAEGY